MSNYGDDLYIKDLLRQLVDDNKQIKKQIKNLEDRAAAAADRRTPQERLKDAMRKSLLMHGVTGDQVHGI